MGLNDKFEQEDLRFYALVAVIGTVIVATVAFFAW